MDRKRKSSTYLILIVCLFLSTFVKAQSDSSKWQDHGSINLSGTYIDVNNNTQLLFVGTGSNVLTKNHFQLSTIGSLTQLTKNNVEISNDWVIKVQPRLIYNDWSAFNYEQFSKIYSRKIDFRSEFGIGGGTYFIKTLPVQGTISYGLIYFDTKYIDHSRVNGIRQSPRLQVFGNVKKFNYMFELYYQPLLTDISNYNYNYTVRLSDPVTSRVAISIALLKTFEYYNFGGTQNSNLNWIVGLTYKY